MDIKPNRASDTGSKQSLFCRTFGSLLESFARSKDDGSGRADASHF